MLALYRQRQDDLAVLGLPIVAPEQVGHGPDQGRVICVGDVIHLVLVLWDSTWSSATASLMALSVPQ